MVVKIKQLVETANYRQDVAHVMIPESLQESEHCVQVAFTQNTLQAYDTGTPRAIPWTINRKTGVVMAEDYTEELTEVTINRPFKGHSPKEVLTVFFFWDPERTDHMVNYIACSLDLEMYLSITSELLNVLLNNPLVLRSSYRKPIGEGVRTITYGAHTSLAALQKSHKFVTNITTADNHQRVCYYATSWLADAQVDTISVYYSCGIDHRRRFSPASGHTKPSTLPKCNYFFREVGRWCPSNL